MMEGTQKKGCNPVIAISVVYFVIFITSSSVNFPENIISDNSSLSSVCMTTADCCLVIQW